MTVQGEGRNPTRNDMLALAPDFDIPPKEAHEVFGQVRAAVDDWSAYAGATGVSRTAREEIGARLGAG